MAALDLLESGGGDGVRMADIARKAGISRQAVYLHFRTRAELLIAATHLHDEIKGSNVRLQASRVARSGVERLDAYIDAWSNYIPEIYGVAKAFLAMRERDEEAARAWDERMLDMREGCEAAIAALDRDGALRPEYGLTQATDLLWMLLSVRNWEQLTQQCGWPQDVYSDQLKQVARRLFVIEGTAG